MALKGRGMRGDWVDLAAILMLLAGSIDGIQGLIAIIRNHYYSLAPNEILIFDLTTWGWILLVWGHGRRAGWGGTLAALGGGTLVRGRASRHQLGRRTYLRRDARFHALGGHGECAHDHRPLRPDREVGGR
jgi:hypothetical protein